MEALSVEDGGEGVCYNVYVYNVQPGVVISYADGDSHLADSEANGEIVSYVLNTNSKKFHQPGAACADSISESNRQDYSGTGRTSSRRGTRPAASASRNRITTKQKPPRTLSGEVFHSGKIFTSGGWRTASATGRRRRGSRGG